MRYYIIAGEPSGDLHGSNLIRGILDADPRAEIRFWGGDLMSEAAGESGTLVRHYKEESVMGFIEVVMKLRKITRSMNFCREDIAEFAPDVLILIDYAGFNLRMAKFARSRGIKTFYYIAPKVWAWKESRVKKIQASVDKLFVIFPFEVEYFSRFGIDVYFGGNPLMDSIAQNRAQCSPEEFRLRHNIPLDRRIVALVAGSRRSEIENNLPTMVSVAQQRTDLHFVITGVDWLSSELYQKIIGDTKNITLVVGETTSTLLNSQAALVTSGTATLETALMGVPQVVCYRGLPISIWIGRRVIRINWISLVNIVMNRTVVTELIQGDFNTADTLSHLDSILPGGDKHDKIIREYAELRELIGEAGASSRVAREMVKTLEETR